MESASWLLTGVVEDVQRVSGEKQAALHERTVQPLISPR